jgi:hypothetical protein
MTAQTSGPFTYGAVGALSAGSDPIAQFVGSFRWNISEVLVCAPLRSALRLNAAKRSECGLDNVGEIVSVGASRTIRVQWPPNAASHAIQNKAVEIRQFR